MVAPWSHQQTAARLPVVRCTSALQDLHDGLHVRLYFLVNIRLLAHPSLNRFSYYGIAASALLSILNYLLLGFALEVYGFYLHSYVRFTRILTVSLIPP